MAKKKREKMENEIEIPEEQMETMESLALADETPAIEVVAEKEPVLEPIPEPVELPKEKTVVIPILPITEVARKFKQYKKYHDAAILAFCASTGLAIEGTEAEMKKVLKKFGF